jgi:hypothetical protein
MFIKVEPAEFFMYRVILVFDLESPNSEDQEVRDYMTEWELEPKYQRTGDFEGSNSEIMQFGGCYLGRHLGKISEIQRSHVEREIITAEIARLLDESDEPVAIPEASRQQTMQQLVAAFHQPEAFQPNDEGLLEAVLDAPAVRQAARELLAAPAGD